MIYNSLLFSDNVYKFWSIFIMNFIKSFFSQNKSMSKYPKEELKKRLTPMQYKVTQENGTEPPFKSTINVMKMNTTIPRRKEFLIALFAASPCSLLTWSLIADADGQHFTMNWRKQTLPRRWITHMECTGLRLDAASVTATWDISLMMGQRTRQGSDIASIVQASISRKRNDKLSKT